MSDQWRTTIPFLPEQFVLATAALGPLLAEIEQLRPRVRSGPDGWQMVWAIEQEKKAQRALEALGAALAADWQLMPQGEESGVNDLDPLGIASLRIIADRGLSDDFDMRPDGWVGSDRNPGAAHAMVLVEGRNPEQVRSVLASINAHATCVRACLFRENDDPLALLHARDDPGRGSTLRPLLRLLNGGTILLPYRTAAGMFFMRVPPPPRLAEAVARMFVEGPRLFAVEARQPIGPRWSANDPPPFSHLPAQQLGPLLFAFDGQRLFDLRRSRFVGQLELTEESLRPPVFIRPPLDERGTGIGISMLRQRLKAADSGFGGYLRLVRTGERSDNRTEIERLRREIAKLRREERRLQSASAPRLRLLRCGDAQFPSLVRALADVHAAGNDAELSIRYGRESSAKGLVHYVVFDKAADSLQIWDSGKFDVPGADWFWSDPTWSQHYLRRTPESDRAGRINLFVPVGLGLEPFPHAWEADEFDAFVGAAVKMWAGKEVAVTPGSVLIFERASDQPTSRLTLTALPPGAFARLEPPVVGWLNDVSVVTASVPSLDALLALSISKEAEQIVGKLELERRSRRQEAEAMLSGVMADIAGEAESVLAEYAGHVRQFTEIGASWRDKVVELEHQVQQFAAQYEQLGGLVVQIDATHRRIVALSGRSDTQRDQQTRTALERLNQIEGQVNANCTWIDARITAMETHLQGLRKRLKEFSIW